MLPIESECVQRAISGACGTKAATLVGPPRGPVLSDLVAELTALVNVGGARLVLVAARREPAGGALFPASG